MILYLVTKSPPPQSMDKSIPVQSMFSKQIIRDKLNKYVIQVVTTLLNRVLEFNHSHEVLLLRLIFNQEATELCQLD